MNITVGLLNLMGSQLEVSSEYGKGSEFSFTLCQKIVKHTKIDEQTEKEPRKKTLVKHYTAIGAKILLVDDNSVNRLVVKKFLKNTGIQIDEAKNGIECIEKYLQNDYDLILLDHMMPVMDGMEALKKIQESEKYQIKRTVMIALTANAIVGAKDMYMQAGFDEYLDKPILPEHLDEVMLKYLPGVEVLPEE